MEFSNGSNVYMDVASQAWMQLVDKIYANITNSCKGRDFNTSGVYTILGTSLLVQVIMSENFEPIWLRVV